jgi:hypothetical protein
MMPTATSRSIMHLITAKALSRHDRVNHMEDACGIVATRCRLLKFLMSYSAALYLAGHPMCLFEKFIK